MRSTLLAIRWKAAILLLALLVVSGCDPEKPGSQRTSARPAPSAKKDEVRLEAVSIEEWELALKGQRGHIVVVDTWATWCVPCKKAFPELVEFQRHHARDGVVCMSVSVDKSKDSDAALQFLKEREAKFPNYRIDTEKPSWWERWKMESIPAVLVFDQEGKLARLFSDPDDKHPFTYADVEKLVSQLKSKGR